MIYKDAILVANLVYEIEKVEEYKEYILSSLEEFAHLDDDGDLESIDVIFDGIEKVFDKQIKALKEKIGEF